MAAPWRVGAPGTTRKPPSAETKVVQASGRYISPRDAKWESCPWPAFTVTTVRRPRFFSPCRLAILPIGCGLGGGKRAIAKNCGRPNGSDAKLHGQGPCAEARAARGALHVRRANARRVTPRGFDVPSRLGRRAGAGPCQLLRRVRPPIPNEFVGLHAAVAQSSDEAC